MPEKLEKKLSKERFNRTFPIINFLSKGILQTEESNLGLSPVRIIFEESRNLILFKTSPISSISATIASPILILPIDVKRMKLPLGYLGAMLGPLTFKTLNNFYDRLHDFKSGRIRCSNSLGFNVLGSPKNLRKLIY